ncbi:MAG: mannosyltransferase family protein [Anaerolineae bacterium]
MQAIIGRFPPLRGHIQQVARLLNQPEYFWITRPLMAFLITRTIVFLGAYLAEIGIPSIAGAGFYHVNPNNVWLDVWARWDSAFYIRIVENGYWFVPGQQSAVAFFPLYPLMVSLLAPIFGTLAAGILVSNICLFGALIFLYKLTEMEFDAASAGRTVFYIAAFPMSFFFTSVYTESTFLFFSVSTMYFARKKMWAWAGLFGLLCASSRIVGVVIWGIVGLEWLRSHSWTLGTLHKRAAWGNLLNALKTDWLNLIAICMIPLGLLSYMVFLNHEFGDPVAFSTTQSAWGREMLGPFTVVSRDIARLVGGNFLTGDIWWHVILDLGAYFAVLGIAVSIWRRLGTSYALYCIISIVIPSMSGTGSLSRYAQVIFPMFMLLGYWGNRQWLDRALTISFSVMLGILTTMFVNWIFVA